MKHDLLLKNGNFVTMDRTCERCGWITVKDGVISDRGVGNPLDSETDADVIIDLKNKTVLPGLMDCHVHTLVAGINLTAVPLEQAGNIDEVLQLMEKACRNSDSEWVFGANYVPQNIQEHRYPDKWELDRISHGKKIMIMAATLHGCATNSEGLKICDVPYNIPGVEKEADEPSGIFSSDESSFLATANVLGSLPDEVIWRFIEDCCANAVSKGVTTMHGLFGQFVKNDRDVSLILDYKDRLPLEMVIFYQTWDVSQALALGLPRVGGCLTLDGALFEYTMANFEPFNSAPALRGVLYHNDDEVYQVVSRAHAANIQCSMHAVGERAIDQLIYTYRRVIMEQGRKDLRHRIEHFCLPTQNQIAMAKELGLIVSMQPGFTYLWDRADGGEFEFCLGRDRADRWDPFNRIIDAGCTVCGGSDCPVTPVDPLLNIASCVHGHNPIRNISVDDAIRMYTINAAYAVNLEKTKGSIEIGKDADFVVINIDPYQCSDRDEIYELAAEMTIKSGAVIYRR